MASPRRLWTLRVARSSLPGECDSSVTAHPASGSFRFEPILAISENRVWCRFWCSLARPPTTGCAGRGRLAVPSKVGGDTEKHKPCPEEQNSE